MAQGRGGGGGVQNKWPPERKKTNSCPELVRKIIGRGEGTWGKSSSSRVGKGLGWVLGDGRKKVQRGDGKKDFLPGGRGEKVEGGSATPMLNSVQRERKCFPLKWFQKEMFGRGGKNQGVSIWMGSMPLITRGGGESHTGGKRGAARTALGREKKKVRK